METLVNSTYTREDIVQRIVYTIAKKWQISEKEVAARFDPLMMLLVEVIAQEMDIINTQWEMSVQEMTETIIQRFFPKYSLKEHLPHIAVLQAKPLEHTAVLPAYFNFQLHQADHVLHFTPIQETKILNITQHSFWVNDQPFVQSAAFQSKSGNPVRSIALLCNKAADLEYIDGLQLFIDTGTIAERAILLYALQHGTCTVNGMPVDINIGYRQTSGNQTDFWSILQSLSYALYHQQFLSLSQKEKLKALPYEHSVWQHLSEKDKKSIEAQHAVYIKWELPVQFQERWLNQLSIHFNAFVGINRKQASVQHKLDPFVNVVPLAIDQHLLFVEQVKGDAEEQYSIEEFGTEESLQDGTCLLKAANFGKMSSDGLRNSVQDLKQQVNSSNAFFSNVSNEYIGRHLQDMQRIIYRLEDKMRQAISLKQQMQYLIVKPFRNNKFVSVDYWTFDNTMLEKLRPETVLESKGSLIEKASARLLTKPYPLSTNYKNSLGTALHQIVSKNDVESLAQNVFGSYLDHVEIKKEYQTSSDLHQHKQLTLAININLKVGYDMEFVQLDNNRIQYEMERNSLLSYPFAVNIVPSNS